MDEIRSLVPVREISSAFAAACRVARTDHELIGRCLEAVVGRCGTADIWFLVKTDDSTVILPTEQPLPEQYTVVARCESGKTTLIIATLPELTKQVKPVADTLVLGLSVTLELHDILQSRQTDLDDAVFQLRALRQVARLLSSVHSMEETEVLVLDFMAEVFFAWWACVYRSEGQRYLPLRRRSLNDPGPLLPLDRAALDAILPPGSGVTGNENAGLARLLPTTSQLIVPLDAGGERMALLVLGPRMNDLPYGRAELELASTLSFAAAIALKNAELVERLHSAATTDDLTGLLNRRALEERLQAEISRSSRHQVRTTIVLVDLDRFKNINDTLGHAAGDRYLVLIANLLMKHVRALDVVGRLGGDEFVVILPMTSMEEAKVFEARLRAGMDELGSRYPEFGKATLSLGMAEAPKHGATTSALLAAADQALYRAKRAGRNSTAVANDA